MKEQKTKSKNMTIFAAGLDFYEEMMLAIIRQFLLAYTDLKQPHWERAFEMSVTAYGAKHGPCIAFTLLTVLQAIRTERRTVFQFVNPCCENCATLLSDYERHLMRTISFVRKGDMQSAQMEALILCEGYDTRQTLQAVNALNVIFTDAYSQKNN